MTLPRALMVLGLLIALLPFLGVPLSLLRWALLLFGLCILISGYWLRAPNKKEEAVL